MQWLLGRPASGLTTAVQAEVTENFFDGLCAALLDHVYLPISLREVPFPGRFFQKLLTNETRMENHDMNMQYRISRGEAIDAGLLLDVSRIVQSLEIKPALRRRE